jgi:sporulation protein YlmC with PRC-barrel domain
MLDRMSRLHVVRHWIAAGLAVAGFATAPTAAAADVQIVRATDWLGHAVKTRDGKELGTVRDLGVDARTGRVVFVVVSVGSFLIENNLIAVAPDALSRSDVDENVFLIDSDPVMLRDAKRFASSARWPTAPDVLRSENVAKSPPPAPTEVLAPAAPTAPPPEGTATIESKSKTAHLSANERYIKDNAPPPAPPPASPPPPKQAAPTAPGASATSTRPEPITKFDRLDKDGDGVLNRSEFAPVITRKDSYSKIDTNADGVIERDEFDGYEKAHGQTDQ